GRQAESLVEGLDGLAGRLQNIDETFVRADFELLARLAVDVRRAQHRVPLDARRQRDRPDDDGPGPLRRVDNLVRGPIEHFVIEGFHSNPYAFTPLASHVVSSKTR